ncbi:MAG: hypothetical protein G5663_00555 [Serratia symbiotica]|nr:hypothetical protein [Serratia symbiotica]
MNTVRKWDTAALANQGYLEVRLPCYHREALVIDIKRQHSFDIAVYADYSVSGTRNMLGSIGTYIVQAFLIGTYYING